MLSVLIQKISPRLRHYRSEQGGAAAAEFALVLSLLIVPILNVADLAVFAWDRMQVDNAAQMATQAAWTACPPPTFLPATSNCAGLSAAVAKAAASTSLGSAITVTSTTENYYCVNSSNALVPVGTFPGTKPSDCSSVGSASDTVGDYVMITVSYSYAPLFPAVSIASTLSSSITRTAWMRLG